MVLEVVKDRPAEDVPAEAQRQQAARLLTLALSKLSERAVVAVASLFSLIVAGSVWWLAMSISAAPTDKQLITLGLYATFAVVLHVVRRR